MVVLKRTYLCLLCLCAFAACTSTTRLLLTPSIPARQTNYKKIAVYIQEPPRKSRPLALLAVARDGENSTWAVEVLKMEAAEIGADAITHIEVSYSTGFFATLRVQALAVKYE